MKKLRTSKCFAMDGSKTENKPFIGFAAIDISDGISCKFRIAKIVSTFTAEALAIGETLEIIVKTESEQNFVFLSDSESVLKGISNIAITLLKCLKTKQKDWNCERKNIQFYWILGHCGVEVNKTADSEAKQSIKEGRDSQLLLPVADHKVQWKKKGIEELHSFCENTKKDRGESYFERYTGMAHLCGFTR
jgi:ribonuclease HI